jgi:twinkle protein
MQTTLTDISARLASQAGKVAAMLLPSGKLLNGKEWVCGDITGRPGDSLKVVVHGTYSGQWRDWSTDSDKGDLIDLWRLSKNVSAGEAIKQIKDYLGIVDNVKIEKKTYVKPPQINESVPNPEGKLMRWLTQDRKLSEETIASYGISCSVEKKAVIFPCFSPTGELINRSYRTLDTPKRVWQDTGCAPCLFGWQTLKEETYRTKTILIAEGQCDAMTWHQWGFPALSIPNGAGMTWIDTEWDNLEAFDTIYLSFDQDGPGAAFTDTVINRLGKHRCLIVCLPKKDANDCLKAGYTAIDAQEWIKNAKTPTLKKLVVAKDLAERLSADILPKEEPFTLPFLKNSDYASEQGFWYRNGEVTILAGYASVGKTTYLNFLQSNLVAEQRRVFTSSLEMKAEKLLRRLIETFHGRAIDDRAIKSFLNHAGEYLAYVDYVGSLKKEELLEMMWFAYRRYGCEHFIIDSLMRIEGLEEDYPAQGEFVTTLQNFAKQSNSHVHLVAHMGKPQNVGTKPADPSMYSVKGSSLLVNGADNVILLRRNPEKKNEKMNDEQKKALHDVEIIVEKQRETGWTGTIKLNYDPHRRAYSKV